MAKIYADLIKNGVINKKTGIAYAINDVPKKIRADVKKLLAEEL